MKSYGYPHSIDKNKRTYIDCHNLCIMKKCSYCKKMIDFYEFYKCTSSKDGFGNICKICNKEYARSDKCKKKRQERDKNNRKYLNKKHNEYAKLHRKKLNDHQKSYYHKYWEYNRKKKNEYSASPKGKAINNAKTARRRAKLALSSFNGFSEEISKFYRNCPEGFHVDHIVPLNGKEICGLHVPWNLQYLLASDNLKKSNKV